MVRNILRIEGLAVLLSSLYLYQLFEGSWMTFILLFFVPDLSIAGYLTGKKIGAITYNLVHNYALALSFILLGLILKNHQITLFGTILASHVGLDRLLGFGLKYPANFKQTHIQKL